MRIQKKTTTSQKDQLITGLFSRKEAALKISEGVRHLHSTILGAKDACASVTHDLLQERSVYYPWASHNKVTMRYLRKSSERQETISQILASTSFGKSSRNSERLKSVAEELLSNSFYHAYKNKNGIDKYPRQQQVELEPEETISIGFKESSNGIYLCIADQGGSLNFENFASSLKRCYSAGEVENVMEQKSSGAGLGLFLIFENITHLIVTVEPMVSTSIACWISTSTSFDSDTFSFNFFERKQK